MDVPYKRGVDDVDEIAALTLLSDGSEELLHESRRDYRCGVPCTRTPFEKDSEADDHLLAYTATS